MGAVVVAFDGSNRGGNDIEPDLATMVVVGRARRVHGINIYIKVE